MNQQKEHSSAVRLSYPFSGQISHNTDKNSNPVPHKKKSIVFALSVLYLSWPRDATSQTKLAEVAFTAHAPSHGIVAATAMAARKTMTASPLLLVTARGFPVTV
jgi:hypothetical protein